MVVFPCVYLYLTALFLCGTGVFLFVVREYTRALKQIAALDFCFSTCLVKCHWEPARTLAWQSPETIGNLGEIATPVCGLVRNDILFCRPQNYNLRIPYAERMLATGRGAQRMLFDRHSL